MNMYSSDPNNKSENFGPQEHWSLPASQPAESSYWGNPAQTSQTSEFTFQSSDITFHHEPDTKHLQDIRVDGPARKNWKRSAGGIGGAILIALAKFKAILSILFSLKFLVLFKFIGLTGITALISIFAYSFNFGWEVAAGIVVLMFVHEMGHFIVCRLKGVQVSAPIFIPFLGAAVWHKQRLGVKDQAEVAIAGPLFGGIGAAIALVPFFFTGNPIWVAISYLTFLLNLFNMAPVSPLDGGRVAAALSRVLWIVGIVILAGTLIFWFNVITIIILVFGAAQAWEHWNDSKKISIYNQITDGQRLAIGTLYFCLAAFLVGGMIFTQSMLG